MWDPGFEVERRAPARLSGYHRSFCMRSIHHRGTKSKPGLVLALDRSEGAACDGLALAVAPENAESTLKYLRERELISSAYVETRLPATLEGGQAIEVLAFVIDRKSPQYCRGLALEEQARIIMGARGGRGPNAEYLLKTAARMAELGIEDSDLQWLARRVSRLSR